MASAGRPVAQPVAKQPIRFPEPAAPVFRQRVVVAPVAPVVEARPPIPSPVKAEPLPLAVAPPLPVRELVQPVVPPVQEEAPAAVKPMRTLEEVRADLARLRASAKERHAQVHVPVRRDVAFEPTDFMDFAKPEPPPSEDSESFAATAYLDFTTLKPRENT